MRQKKAKAIAKAIYGDMSRKAERRKGRYSKTGQIVNDPNGLRARYQRAKKDAEH